MPEEGKRKSFIKSEIQPKGCNPPDGFVCETHAPIDYEISGRTGIMSHLYHHPCFQDDINSGKCKHNAPAGLWKSVPLGDKA